MIKPGARAIALTLCSLYFVAPVHAEDAQKATVCQVQKDPAAYHRKLIEITGAVSRGFENFTIFDAACEARPGVWVEYGGTTTSGATYCCGAPEARPQNLEIEGIEIPLVNDDRFRRLDGLLKRPDTVVRATVVGWFFAKPSRDEGYGHFGCCHLFVIQQVLTANPR